MYFWVCDRCPDLSRLRALGVPMTRGGARAIPDQWPIVDQPRPGAGIETLVHVPEFEFSHNRA